MPSEPDFFPLKKVMQRVKAVRQIDGMSRLRAALQEDRILAVAGTLRLFKSKYCFEFSENNVRLVHKSQDLKDLELNAFNARKNDEHTFILPLKRCRHVFVEICLSEIQRETRLLFREPIAFEFVNDGISYCDAVYRPREFKDSRYRRDHILTRWVASDVWCRASDVEIEFPYTDEFATRKPRGRPQKWPPEKSFEYAARYWMDMGNSVSSAALVTEILNRYHEDLDNAPAKSIVETHVREFLKSPQPVQSQAFQLIEATINSLPPDADNSRIQSEVTKKYKKFGFTPSFSTLMRQIADVRSRTPDK